MSRVGKQPVKIPSNIKVSYDSGLINLAGAKEKKSYHISEGINVNIDSDQIVLSVKDESDQSLFMRLGTDRNNLQNIVEGLHSGFKIVLEINGVGYKASVVKNILILSLGFSHEIMYVLPEGVNAAFEKPNLIVISGSDRVLVGNVASEIISFRKPEPYKGKGIKIQGQKILRKEGKKK